jgi:type II secretory pathway predicted ATPase ExeA
LLEDFPKNHNLILIGHPCLRDKLQLPVNADIHSRITWSGELKPLAPETTSMPTDPKTTTATADQSFGRERRDASHRPR